MMREEFEALVGQEVTPDEYAEIEFVYNFHPAIPEVGGKARIAELYKVGGLGLILSMKACALEAEDRDNRMREIRAEISSLNRELTALLAIDQSVRDLWRVDALRE